MAVKQHCDICDCVIPREESFRTIHFGRGNNLTINIGVDPKVICKKCWTKMLEAVKPDALVNEEAMLERASMKAEIKHEERVGDLVNDITNYIVKGKDRSCESCVYGNGPLTEAPCCNCTGKSNWEAKNEQ